jgi:hypothetical protein
MTTRTEWTGTASEGLAEQVGGTQRKSKSWPNARRALAGRLRRAATFLRKVGIEVTFRREGRAWTRTIRLTAAPEKPGAQPSAPSAPSAPTPKSNPANGFAAQSVRTVARDADGSGNGNAPTVRTDSLKNNAGTVADDADAMAPAVLVQRNCRLSERRCGPSTGAREFSTN